MFLNLSGCRFLSCKMGVIYLPLEIVVRITEIHHRGQQGATASRKQEAPTGGRVIRGADHPHHRLHAPNLGPQMPPKRAPSCLLQPLLPQPTRPLPTDAWTTPEDLATDDVAGRTTWHPHPARIRRKSKRQVTFYSLFQTFLIKIK